MKRNKRLYFAEVHRLMGAGLVREGPDGKQKKVVGGGEDVALLDDMPEPAKAEPLTVVQIVEPEHAVEQLENVRSWAIQFQKAGDLNGERMEKLVAGVKRAEDLLKSQAKQIRVLEQSIADSSGSLSLRSAAEQFLPIDEAPKGLDRMHFNLTVMRPDEIGYRALMESNGLSGITPQARAFAEHQVVNPVWMAKLYEWQYLNDQMLLKYTLLEKGGFFDGVDGGRRARFQHMREWKTYARLTREIMRAAADSATAGEGLEWIPTVFSAQLHMLVQTELKVSSMFQWPTMPSATWKDPVEGADAIAYFIGEALTDPEVTNKIPDSVPGTAQLTLTAKKIAARVVLSREFDEDSIVPAVPEIFRKVAKALARGREKALIDGQASGAIDTGAAVPATDVRQLWDGMRKIATVAGTKVDISTLSAAELLAMKGSMKGTGKEDHFGYQQDDGVWFPSYSCYIRLMALKEPTTNTPLFMSREKFGDKSIMETGVLGFILGSPVVITPFMREDLNATGIWDNVTTTKTGLLYANRPAFKGGSRRVMTVRRYDELKAETDQITVIGTERLDWKPVFGNSAKAVSYGYNVASY